MAKKDHWKYEGRPRYDVNKHGLGDARQWNQAFYARMGFEEAQRVRDAAQKNGTWKPEHKILADAAGIFLDDKSMWSQIKTAFRKAAMNVHPDRITETGMTFDDACEKFKEVSAAYAILAKKYGED
jgi:hypothetical protein